jgi:hypothetical protein
MSRWSSVFSGRLTVSQDVMVGLLVVPWSRGFLCDGEASAGDPDTDLWSGRVMAVIAVVPIPDRRDDRRVLLPLMLPAQAA